MLRALTKLRLTGKVCVAPMAKYVSDAKQRRELIHKTHSELTTGHWGVKKTLDTLKRRYFWPRMQEEVNAYVNGCVKCQALKKLATPRAPITITTTASQPFEKVFLDLVGPLPGAGPKYILTIQDEFSKYLVTEAIKDKSSTEVAKMFVTRWVLIFGAPTTVLTDRGTEFKAMFEEVCRTLVIEQKTSTAYHHQTIGGLENSHKSLGNYLRTFASEKDRWQKLLPYFQFAFNNTTHLTTGYAPFEILFGYPARMTDDLRHNGEGLQRPKDYEAYVERLRATLKIVHCDVHSHTVKQKFKNAEMEKGKQTRTFNVGDLALVTKENRTKLDPIRTGPMKITKIDYPNIQLESGEVLHVDRIRHYRPPPLM